ncbi:MAG: phosphatase PAP2 family protein [Thermoanaerobaculia bacterium]
MPDIAEDPEPKPRRSRFLSGIGRPYLFEIVILIQLLLFELMQISSGFLLSSQLVLIAIREFVPATLLDAAAGVLLHIGWSAFRGRGREYLRTVFSGKWLLLTARIMFAETLMIYTYGWIKLLLPLTRDRWFDAQLWQADRIVFGGMSPNVLFLTLFSWPPFLRLVDLSYGYLFFTALTVSTALFLSLRSERLRVAFATGSIALWSVSAWLYYLVPSMGPAYRFGDVWFAYEKYLPVTRSLQHALLRSFLGVLKLREHVIDPAVRFTFGIAAFPSLHVGFTTFVALWIGVFSRRMGLLAGLVAAMIFVGSVITGWHYFIDSLAGAVLGVLCFAWTYRMYRIGEVETRD